MARKVENVELMAATRQDKDSQISDKQCCTRLDTV